MAESWDRAIAVAGAAVLRSDDGCAMAHTEAYIHTTATHTNPYPDSSDPYGPGPGAHDPGRYAACPVDVSHANRDLHKMAVDGGILGRGVTAVGDGHGQARAGRGSQGRDGDAVEVQAVSGMASPPDVDLTSTGNGYPYYSSPREPASLPDAIEQIRAERDILRCRVEERAHDCANVEAERDRLRKENAELLGKIEQLEASAPKADLSAAGYFSPAAEPSYVCRSMTEAEVKAQVKRNRGLTLEEGEAYEEVLKKQFGELMEEAGP